MSGSSEQSDAKTRDAALAERRARARAYLDLWERNLTHLATHGLPDRADPRPE